MHLERLRPRVAAHPADRDPVRADLFHLGLGDVRHDVGREVGRRVVHLVEQLLLHRRASTSPPVPSAFPTVNAAVGVDLDDREADRVEVGHVLEPRVGEVPAGDLRPALDQVPGDGGAGEPSQSVSRPAEVGHRRPDRQRRVGHAPGDHHLAPARSASAMAAAPR